MSLLSLLNKPTTCRPPCVSVRACAACKSDLSTYDLQNKGFVRSLLNKATTATHSEDPITALNSGAITATYFNGNA